MRGVSCFIFNLTGQQILACVSGHTFIISVFVYFIVNVLRPTLLFSVINTQRGTSDAPRPPMNAAGCHGALRSFPDVRFPPVQHGVGKVRLRLMLHTSSKVSPLPFHSKESDVSVPEKVAVSKRSFPGSF